MNSTDNQRQAVSDVELARLAGFFAGEGSISISGGAWPTLYASLGNTELVWVESFYNWFGGTLYIETPKYSGAKHMFRWRVSGKSAEAFLRTIQPFLMGEKVAQLDLGLEFQALKNAEIPKGGVGRKTRSTTWDKMQQFREEMKKLRRAAAETNRIDALPLQSDSPTLGATPVS